jgi:hypothetical protein
VIGMRVREHNRTGTHPLELSQPIKAAIDHHARAAVRNQQRRMHAMPPSARLDLATCAEKRQVHWKNGQRMVNDAATLENFNRGILTSSWGE